MERPSLTASPFALFDRLGVWIGWLGILAGPGMALCYAVMAASDYAHHVPPSRIAPLIFYAVMAVAGAGVGAWLKRNPERLRTVTRRP